MGRSAFSHKGGLHVDGISKDPTTYEHVTPEAVGNRRRTPVGELSGKNSIRAKAEELGLEAGGRCGGALGDQAARVRRLPLRGSGRLARAPHRARHRRKTLRSSSLRPSASLPTSILKKRRRPRATIKLFVKGQRVISTAEGNGPVNALDNALRQAIEPHYPELKAIHLSNYKVRILDEHRATAATTRVLIDSTDSKRMWGAVGVGENIIEASWQALVDGLEYGVNVGSVEESRLAEAPESGGR